MLIRLLAAELSVSRLIDDFDSQLARTMHVSSTNRPGLSVPVAWSPTRILHPFWGNFRVAVIRTRSLDRHNQARGQTGLRHLGRLPEFERELISERTKVGLIFVRARSRKGGDR